MKRRSLLLSSMILGAFAPRRLFGQDSARRVPNTARSRRVANNDSENDRRASRIRDDEEDGFRATDPEFETDLSRLKSGRAPETAQPAGEGDALEETVPAAFPNEPGHQWRTFNLAKYTGLPHKDNNPQTAVIDWIFRATKSAPWHGEKIAVLCASRTQLKAYNSPKVLSQVSSTVERFVDAYANVLSMRVRFVTASDTRWRYAVQKALNPVGSGPQGQQIWTLKMEDAAFVLSQMQVWQGFRLHTDEKVEMINGQTLKIQTSEPRPFTGGIQRDSAVGLGFQPKTETLEEGMTLRISPLLKYEGDMFDAAIEFSANTVRAYHRTKVLAPREIGPGEVTLDIPEVSQTRLDYTVMDWPVDRTLLISGGIHPGILQDKGGLFNMRIPGTVPTRTELLAFVDVTLADRPKGRG